MDYAEDYSKITLERFCSELLSLFFEAGIGAKTWVDVKNKDYFFADFHFHYMHPERYDRRKGIDVIIEQSAKKANIIGITDRGNDESSGKCQNKEMSYGMFVSELKKSKYTEDVTFCGELFTHIKSGDQELIFVKAQEIWTNNQKRDIIAICSETNYGSTESNLPSQFETTEKIMQDVTEKKAILYYPHPFSIRRGKGARVANISEQKDIEKLIFNRVLGEKDIETTACGFDAIEVFNSYNIATLFEPLLFKSNIIAKQFMESYKKYRCRAVAASDGHYDIRTLGSAGVSFKKDRLELSKGDEEFRSSLKHLFANEHKKLITSYSTLVRAAWSVLVTHRLYVDSQAK